MGPTDNIDGISYHLVRNFPGTPYHENGNLDEIKASKPITSKIYHKRKFTKMEWEKKTLCGNYSLTRASQYFHLVLNVQYGESYINWTELKDFVLMLALPAASRHGGGNMWHLPQQGFDH